jgi:hypothetical protein
MKVGDLVVYNLGPKTDDPKQWGVVLSERPPAAGSRVFRIYFPHFDEHLNGWEEEYKVVNEGR